jgi:predicted nucleotidyltransferase
MPFGLDDKTINKIEGCLKQHPKIEKAILYGSRAKGNYRNGSDIDLVLKGAKLKFEDLAQLENNIDDLLLPYKFDISIYHHINNPDLLEHIERVGKVFFVRLKSKQT